MCKQCDKNSEFEEKSRKVHGDKYDYRKVDFINVNTPVIIVCPEHGEFKQAPINHLNGQGCPICGRLKSAKSRTSTTEEFISKSRKIHGDKYDYSKVDYKGSKTKVCIICPVHGEFWQRPNEHLSGNGCSKCGRDITGEKRGLTIEKFIDTSNKVHNNFYDYSKVKKVRRRSIDKVTIICPIHGEFEQTPRSHMDGEGCPRCSYELRGQNMRKDPQVFVDEATEFYNGFFKYDKVVYKGNKTKVCVICPEHGDFWVTPNAHLRGVSCPKCSQSSFECKVRGILNEYNIQYTVEQTFKWMGLLRLDFFLPEYNVAIECQGEQHYEPVDYAGNGKEWANEQFEKCKERDKRKLDECKKHGIPIIYIKYDVENIEGFLLKELGKYGFPSNTINKE